MVAESAEAPAQQVQRGAAHRLGDSYPLSFALGSPRGRQVSRAEQMVAGDSHSFAFLDSLGFHQT